MAPQSEDFVQLVSTQGPVYIRRSSVTFARPVGDLKLYVHITCEKYEFHFDDAATRDRALVLLINPPTP